MTDIYEYRQKIIAEIDKFIENAGLQSYEVTDGIQEAARANPTLWGEEATFTSWRNDIYKSDDVAAINKTKEFLFKLINLLAKRKHDKELNKTKEEQKKSEDYWKEDSQYWQSSSEWWKKYNAKQHDWQEDQKKRDEENKKWLEESEKNRDEKHKKEFISEIEMELIKENVSDERLSKKVGVSDWREKIRQADGFSAALSMKSSLKELVWRNLKNEYTCASCGVKKEEYTAYEVGSKKCCSYECEKALKGKDKKSSDNPSTNHKDNFGFSSVSEFFAWMKKMGVNKIEFDFNANQVIISCNGNKKLSVSDSNTGLTTEQQTALTERFKSEKDPITFNQVQSELEKDTKNKGGNKGIIAAIVIVGVVLAIVIGIVIHKNKRKDYY